MTSSTHQKAQYWKIIEDILLGAEENIHAIRVNISILSDSKVARGIQHIQERLDAVSYYSGYDLKD